MEGAIWTGSSSYARNCGGFIQNSRQGRWRRGQCLGCFGVGLSRIWRDGGFKVPKPGRDLFGSRRIEVLSVNRRWDHELETECEQSKEKRKTLGTPIAQKFSERCFSNAHARHRLRIAELLAEIESLSWSRGARRAIQSGMEGGEHDEVRRSEEDGASKN
jgi:hypothetical protein